MSDTTAATPTPRLCSFESRRESEMATLIAKLGGEPTIAPSMREIPLTDNPAAFAFGEDLLAGRIDLVIFLTGVGAKALVDCLETRLDRDAVLDRLRQTEIAVRGPKPTAVLNGWDVPIAHRAPSPNTHVELLATLAADADLAGRVVAIQEYGRPNEELYDGLRAAGAEVRPVPVYRWALPEETGPLEEAITAAGDFDAFLFTSAKQIEHVLEVAGRLDRERPLRDALADKLVASVGPECTAGLKAAGVETDVEASPPKMGPLVRAALAALRDRAAVSSAATEEQR